MFRNILVIAVLALSVSAVSGQTASSSLAPGESPHPATDSQHTALTRFREGKYLDQVNRQTAMLNSEITSRSGNYLQQAASEEDQLKARLMKIDPGAAGSLFGNVPQRYSQLQTALVRGEPAGVPGHAPAEYFASLDSMKNTLLFLQANQSKLSGLTEAQAQKLTATIANVQTLESRMQAVTNLQTVLQQRQQYLSQQLNKFGMSGQLGKMNQTVYYYKQQIGDWKASVQDPTRLQQKAMTVLSKLPAYKSFLAQHSYLSKLFGQPESYQLSDSGMKNLQTRAAVEKKIQQKTGLTGSDASSQLSQQMQSAAAAVSDMKSRLESGGGTMPQNPGFTPNGQKTKSLWKRLEYGANMQFEPATTLLPTLADMALSIGYHLNDRATVGVGAAWKMGLGDGLQHIRFSGQGMGLRSYIDWRWKKNLYLSGGYEENYLAAFRNLDQLRSATGWQKSGLIGLSRQYQISGKVKGKAQLLFDFLSFSQIPKAQPVVFRVGWSF